MVGVSTCAPPAREAWVDLPKGNLVHIYSLLRSAAIDGLLPSSEARVKISGSNSMQSRGISLPAISCGSKRAQLVLDELLSWNVGRPHEANGDSVLKR